MLYDHETFCLALGMLLGMFYYHRTGWACGGIITPGVKTTAKAGNRILLRNGVPVARLQGDELEILGGAESIGSAEAERHLRVVRPIPASKTR